jgi:hypothetical protein
MTTASLANADRFDAEYPEVLADRLAWLESRLHVPRSRILRLMGLSSAEASSLDRRAWPDIVQAHETQANRTEHLLTHYLSYFDHDPEKAADFARDFSRKIDQGTFRLSDYVPGLTSTATPAEEEEALLCFLREEGPGLLTAIARILAAPAREV